MDDYLALFLRTLLIGVAVAAPVGAMGVLCIQRTLAGGWLAGFATGAGIATADAAYAACAAFGVTAVSAAIEALQAPLRLAGGAVLVWLGVRAIVAPVVHEVVHDEAAVRGYGALYASAVGLTLTNPMTIMAFAAVFASAGLAVSGGPGPALVATFGVAIGSLAWWVALVTTVSAARHAVSDRAVHLVNRLSGAAVAAFGIAAIISGVGAYL
jgi:threonine/homoserine/homoserine lactone efflux protein